VRESKTGIPADSEAENRKENRDRTNRNEYEAMKMYSLKSWGC